MDGLRTPHTSHSFCTHLTWSQFSNSFSDIRKRDKKEPQNYSEHRHPRQHVCQSWCLSSHNALTLALVLRSSRQGCAHPFVLECRNSLHFEPVQITDKVQKLAWSAGVYAKAQFNRKLQNVVQVCAVNWGSIAWLWGSNFYKCIWRACSGRQWNGTAEREVLSGWVVRSIGQISVIVPGSEFNLVLSAGLLHRHPSDRDHGQGECSESLSSERGLGASYLRDAFLSHMQQHGTLFSFLEQLHKPHPSHSQLRTFTMYLQIPSWEVVIK